MVAITFRFTSGAQPISRLATAPKPVFLAHATFAAWEHSHPEDPLGPVSNAAAYLFAEFNRHHILESELFTDNQRFERRQRFEDLGSCLGADLTDAEVRYLMEQEWARTEDDVLWRRSKLGLRFSPEQRARLGAFMAANIGT